MKTKAFAGEYCTELQPNCGFVQVGGTSIEIKSGKTLSTSYFDNLKYWRPLASLPEDQGYAVYGGDQSMQTSAGALISWRHLNRAPD